MEQIAPDEVWIEQGVFYTPLAQRVREHAADGSCRVLSSEEIQQALARRLGATTHGHKILVLNQLPGQFLKPCPCSNGSVSCGLQLLDLDTGCLADCSHCGIPFLSTNPLVVLRANLKELDAELLRFFQENPERHLRVRMGECLDSLEWEPLTGYAADLVRIFAPFSRATLELKTKTKNIDSLIGLDPGHTVIAWPVNPPELVLNEERRTASMAERIEAAVRVTEAGYHAAFHFDPLIHYLGWQERYINTLDAMAGVLPPAKLSWFSLGALRFPPSLKQTVQRRFPATGMSDGEFIIGEDGQMRYFRAIRLEMFSLMVEQIRQRFPRAPIYLCMEPPNIWQQVLGHEGPSCEFIEETVRVAG